MEKKETSTTAKQTPTPEGRGGVEQCLRFWYIDDRRSLDERAICCVVEIEKRWTVVNITFVRNATGDDQRKRSDGGDDGGGEEEGGEKEERRGRKGNESGRGQRGGRRERPRILTR